MTEYQTLSCSVDEDGVATLTLDRPDALNAFDLTMAKELERFFATDAHDDAIRAICRGDGTVYRLGWDHVDRWHCSCPAATDRCAHLVALRLVTVRERGAA
jgi:enoyl-CoA hydratase/carnithine racemase